MYNSKLLVLFRRVLNGSIVRMIIPEYQSTNIKKHILLK